MSQQNVEIVQRQNRAFNRGDLEEVFALADPDFAWWDRADDPGAGVHRGRAGVMEMFAEVSQSIADLRIEAEAFIDAGDCVVVPVRVVGRGGASGVPFEEHEVQVFRLRDGKIVELREYRELDEALRAAGAAS
jgi:ketosteroid isomerase-like protein